MAKRDEFDDEGFFDSLLNRKGNAELPPGLRRIFIVVGVLVLFGILISVVVASWPKGGDDVDEGAVPIIRADGEPFKVKPENPGGMNVPNKDSTIFETLKGEKEEGGPENLLEDEGDTASVLPPKAEKPAAPAEIKKSEAKPEPKEEEAAEAEDAMPPEPKEEPKEMAKAETKAQPKAVENPGDISIIDTLKAEAHPETPVTAKPKAAPKQPAPAKTVPVTGGSAYIQLAAVKSEAEASTLWAKTKAKNPELASLSMRTQTVQSGGATLYRVQAGPVSKESAASLCGAVKSRGGNCIMAK